MILVHLWILSPFQEDVEPYYEAYHMFAKLLQNSPIKVITLSHEYLK